MSETFNSNFSQKDFEQSFFTRDGYEEYASGMEYSHNSRMRPDDQDIFDWLMEDKESMRKGAIGETIEETLRSLR
ncbi:MAG: hypothetical protein LBU89_11545 [Fibromonadaceae bacterium]|jgi:hypothetical protein|nr:hypothetical protein [Fibromonadaceae bacterium]